MTETKHFPNLGVKVAVDVVCFSGSRRARITLGKDSYPYLKNGKRLCRSVGLRVYEIFDTKEHNHSIPSEFDIYYKITK